MRVCSGPGCLRKVADNARWCDDCNPQPRIANVDAEPIREHTSGYDEQLDRLRKTPRWQRLAHSVIRSQPLCARCDRISEICDHVVPAREAIAQAANSGRFPGQPWAGYYIRTNLQGLCRSCHGVKTTEDKAHVGPWDDIIAAMSRKSFIL